ncbi:MAG: hypothetical protein WAV54_09255 [Acidimicrobiales bacterium]
MTDTAGIARSAIGQRRAMTDPTHLHVLPTVGTTRGGSILLDMLFVGRGRISRLRYEDVTADRFVELDRLSTEPGVPVNKSRMADESVRFAPSHLMDGNPVRFRREVSIRLGDEWVSATPRSRKLLIGVATTPLLLKYGYSLSGPPRRARQ